MEELKSLFFTPEAVLVIGTFDENGVPILDCRTCAYGKQGPCIGYCISKIEREVFSKTRGWKAPADSPAGAAPVSGEIAGVMT